MSTLAVIGAGVMGETLLAGLLRSGWHATDLVAADRHAAEQQALQNILKPPAPTVLSDEDRQHAQRQIVD